MLWTTELGQPSLCPAALQSQALAGAKSGLCLVAPVYQSGLKSNVCSSEPSPVMPTQLTNPLVLSWLTEGVH